jgi:hypothetical protein
LRKRDMPAERFRVLEIGESMILGKDDGGAADGG